jgi:hypothetical protein
MDLMNLLTDPIFLAIIIPVTAIIVWGIVTIVAALIRHQERMAMIDRGIHPDRPDEEGRDQ